MARRILELIFASTVAIRILYCQEDPGQPHLRVFHYNFSISIPDTGRRIEARAVLSLRRSEPVDVLTLDLLGLHVDSVLMAGKKSGFSTGPLGIRINLNKPQRGLPDTTLVTVCYGGEVTDGLIIQRDAHGRWYAFGDNWPERARYWLPTIDRPDAKATVDWNVTVSTGRTVVANGAFAGVSRVEPASDLSVSPRIEWRWRESRPVPPYVMVVAVGRMVTDSLGLTADGLSDFPPGVSQSVYAAPELADYLPGPFSQAGSIVEFFAKTVAPFPYEKLAHLQSLTKYGGMENASAIFYANDIFRRRAVSTGVIAHETAHQWFGDAVTPGTWAHLWLSEGFATYFEKLWLEHSAGERKFRDGMRELRNEIIHSDVTYRRPVIDTVETDPANLLNTNSYQKGAWTLHMLRSLLGDSLFFNGIREYYFHHRHSTATSDDLCAELESISHTSIRWFFDQWLRRPGLPEISAGWSYDQSNRRIVITVDQKHADRAFRFPLKVMVHNTDGGTQVLTIEVPAQESFRTALSSSYPLKPSSVEFDPDVELLAKITSR